MADEFSEQPGAVKKAWWTLWFVLALLTVGNYDLGIAALGKGRAKFDRARRKAGGARRE